MPSKCIQFIITDLITMHQSQPEVDVSQSSALDYRPQVYGMIIICSHDMIIICCYVIIIVCRREKNDV